MPQPTAAATGAALKDPRLFREACYVNGAWVASPRNETVNVDNPATGEILGAVPKLGAALIRVPLKLTLGRKSF